MPATTPSWPSAGQELSRELSAAPGRVMLLEGSAAATTAQALADAWGTSVIRVGPLLTSLEQPPTEAEVVALLADAAVLSECEILLTPELGLDPLPLLRKLTRSSPRAFVWPGSARGGVASFSARGRRDHYEAKLANAVVLHCRATTFPDEVPYEIERIP